MAWPNTPLTTYVGGTTPWISAVDLNALQSGINGIINGTYSVKSLDADGTGGAVVAPEPGSGRVSAALSALGPANPSIPLGGWGKGGVPLGWGRIRADGVVLRGYNIKNVARLSLGLYAVEFNCSPSDPTNSFCVAGGEQFGTNSLIVNASPAVLSGRQVVFVSIALIDYSTPPICVKYDANFHLIVFGE